jgi:putative SOS response-associated peptidase YedK
MCGRFALTASVEAVQAAFELTSIPAGIAARYNIAPTQPVAVITNQNPRELTFHKWGLVPSWSKDPTMGSRLINARSETAAEKPSFRTSFRRRRCIIPADGFFEWQAQAGGKTPMFIHLVGRPVFAIAGLWDIWQSPDGGELHTCAILTTAANAFMQPIHDRMPVILKPEDYALWLSGDEQPLPALQALMQPCDPAAMSAYPVSKAVNRPGYDAPDVIAPLH